MGLVTSAAGAAVKHLQKQTSSSDQFKNIFLSYRNRSNSFSDRFVSCWHKFNSLINLLDSYRNNSTSFIDRFVISRNNFNSSCNRFVSSRNINIFIDKSLPTSTFFSNGLVGYRKSSNSLRNIFVSCCTVVAAIFSVTDLHELNI
jgi:hypothetical protein